MKRGFYTILTAQFLSSLADNALLIAAIALLGTLGAPEWMTPLLKLFFVISYVVLAAWVGVFADSMPKGRVMFCTNCLKFAGCLLMLFGSHPLLAYAIVGIGAAAYSPAKYGILTELLPARLLVVANGWMEGLTVISIILGVVFGGVLIRPDVAATFIHTFHFDWFGIENFAQAAIFVIAFVYLAASLVNLFIPDTGVRYVKQHLALVPTLNIFMKSCKLLWTDSLGQISLSVTTLFWGAGAVLQFLVLKWCDHALGMNLSEASIMQAVVSIGVAIGAVIAAACVPLKKSLSVLPMGIMMGLLVLGTSYFHASLVPDVSYSFFGFSIHLATLIAAFIMVLVGICAGIFVVPMNALLQHRGHVLMSAGRSIAVQNFNENLSILVMLGLYSLMIMADLSVPTTMFVFGLFVAVSMAFVILKHRRNQARCDTMHLIGEKTRHKEAV